MTRFFMFFILFKFILVSSTYSEDTRSTNGISTRADQLSGKELERFLNSGADLDGMVDECGYTDLHPNLVNNPGIWTNATGIRADKLSGQELERFLNCGVGINERVDEFGTTNLHWVALHQNSSTLRQWIEAGANVNAATDWGTTPIFFAVGNHRPDNVKTLIDAGIDINHKQNMCENILMFAIKELDLVPTETVLTLINHGADVNALNFYRQSPLNLLRARKETSWGEAEIAIETLLISKGGIDSDSFHGKSIDYSTRCPTYSRTHRQQAYERWEDNEECNRQESYNSKRWGRRRSASCNR